MASFGCGSYLPHAGFFFPALGTFSDQESWSDTGLLHRDEVWELRFTSQSAEQGISYLAGVGQSHASNPLPLLERLRGDTGVSLSSS